MIRQGKVDVDEIARRIARFEATVRERGIKLTPQRLEIFREVASRLDHPDAETVHRAVHARMPSVSLDTVYRTLWRLGDLGLVSTVGVRRESVRFDANPEMHHHFVCTRCGLTRDFESAGLPALRLPDTVRELGRVLSTHIEVRGVCMECSRKTDGQASQPGFAPKGRKGRDRG